MARSATDPRLARPALHPDTIRSIEQAAGRLATLSVARMDEELSWFRELPADQRSWVTLVAQAGLQSYVEWLRTEDDVLRMTGDVFATAPKAMARAMSLQQTVELIRLTMFVAEENLPALAVDADRDTVEKELLRFAREIAFAAARVYASAAENRGSWDERLEALVIDNLVRGSAVGDPLPSQLAAFGWTTGTPVAVVVGSAPDGEAAAALDLVHARAQRAGFDAMAGVHAGRLVVLVGGSADPIAVAGDLVDCFGDGPVVAGPQVTDLVEAPSAARSALSGLRAVGAWPGAPRPVSSQALLPERALAGDDEARTELVEQVFRPLREADDVLMETVGAFLDSGGALEATARSLFVHANTVRYRLRRVAEVSGESPTDPRGALTLRVALMLGRLET
ncbi:MAG: PucR family transcriptional regulator [Jatrophihabitans sp.]|uniref:PucR family transcriptional regulator n=1 Tax=Jatrophihabitans sp. TaxID=1932789 RepID=UPI003F7D39ED